MLICRHCTRCAPCTGEGTAGKRRSPCSQQCPFFGMQSANPSSLIFLPLPPSRDPLQVQKERAHWFPVQGQIFLAQGLSDHWDTPDPNCADASRTLEVKLAPSANCMGLFGLKSAWGERDQGFPFMPGLRWALLCRLLSFTVALQAAAAILYFAQHEAYNKVFQG